MDSLVRFLLFALFTGALLCCSARADVLELGADGAVTVRATDRAKAPHDGAPPAAAMSLRPALAKAALDNGLSPALLDALVWQESGWRRDAVSPKGAIGLAQLMPQTARELGVDPHDPFANLRGGARYLRRQLDRFGDLESALAAYNAGPQRVIAAGGVPAIPETRLYVDAILRRIAHP